MNKFKQGFTLAEMLLIMGIIGIVAALTIPTLTANIMKVVTENQQKVFQSKLIKGLNAAKVSGDINDQYSSTEDFLRNGLAKHYKMVSICGKNNLSDCFPYGAITYLNDGKESNIEVSKMKTAKSINLDEPFEDTAAFISADGVPVLISYDKTCAVDTGELDKTISSCVAGIYDINGSNKPNKYAITTAEDGKTIKTFLNDIRSFNGAGIGSIDLFSFKIVEKIFYIPDIYATVGSPKYPNSLGAMELKDYWKAGDLYCKSKGASLPTLQQLLEIAQVLYSDSSIINPKGAYYSLDSNNKESVFEVLGINNSGTYAYEFFLVALDGNYRQSSSYYSRARNFVSDHTFSPTCDRGGTCAKFAICVK